jgi:glycosyltransferase involved in cell wall biosynthesis
MTPASRHLFLGEMGSEGTPFGSPLLLSVIVPCYNEEQALAELERRLVPICERVAADSFEIILVDDGSKDGTWRAMRDVAARNPKIVAVNLSRNFGHQIAVTAGLSISRGKRTLLIDADLQDPPELLPEMMRRMDGGADVVYGQRVQRHGEKIFKKLTAKWFYRILARATTVPIPVDTGDFRLISRPVVEVFLSMPEQYRYVRGMIAWAGFRQEAVPYDRDPRCAGQSKYPLAKMVSFAIDALTGFSVVPLRLMFKLAGLSLLLAVGVGAFALFSLIFLHAVRGWASLLFIFLFFSSVQLLFLSVIGEYMGRTYIQTKQRPLFVIREILTDRAIHDAGTVANDDENERMPTRQPVF